MNRRMNDVMFDQGINAIGSRHGTHAVGKPAQAQDAMVFLDAASHVHKNREQHRVRRFDAADIEVYRHGMAQVAFRQLQDGRDRIGILHRQSTAEAIMSGFQRFNHGQLFLVVAAAAGAPLPFA